MRIALVGPAHPDRGSGARHTTELAHRLAAAGHNVIIESWRAQPPLPENHPPPPTPQVQPPPQPHEVQPPPPPYQGHPPLPTYQGQPYPRTYRRLAWYRPDGWVAAGRRLRSADLVIFALVTPAQVAPYLSVLTRLTLGPKHPRTVLICHAIPADGPLPRTLMSRAATVIVHSAAQAGQVRALASDVPIVIARIPPHLPVTAPPAPVPAPRHPDPDPEPYWAAYLQALQVT